MTIKQMPMQLLTSSDQQSAHLSIMGDITSWPWGDEDTSAMDMSKALAELPSTVGEIFVHINSYGGEVSEGVAIYNTLKAHSAHVTTVCEGFACSIASVIFMAGDRRVMRPASLLMLHNASMGTWGDANDHRKAAEDLDVITELSKTAYLSHATESFTREKLDEVMDAETWVSPEQALEWGLATEIDEPTDADEPTQSARNLVMRSLTNPLSRLHNASDLTGGEVQPISAASITTLEYPTYATLEVAEEHTPAWAEQLFTKISELEQLITNEPAPTPEPEPTPESEPDPEPVPNERNQRLSKIFQQLANQR